MENTLSQSKHSFRILSGSMLKLLAVVFMIIDHAAFILCPAVDVIVTPFPVFGKTISLYWIMRRIGRLAFPIFCFLMAEGFQHTKNQMRYALRLLIFAVISEIPFDLMHSGKVFDLGAQNVYFTLFLGLMLMYALENVEKQLWKCLAMAVICIIATYLNADYGLNGALLTFLIYVLRSTPAAQAVLSYPLLSGGIYALAAFIPINMYNGQRGFIRSPLLKILFYVFYPLHILLLLGIRYLLIKC